MIRHISKMEFDTEFPKEKFISSSTEGINLVLNKYQTLSIDKKKDFLKELQDKITELEKRLAFEYNGKLLEDNSGIGRILLNRVLIYPSFFACSTVLSRKAFIFG